MGSTGSLVRMIAVGEIDPSAFQPRRAFDEASLVRLAASISRSGLMQPIIVRPGAGGRYELVAGERRWRAATLAGLSEVPAVVRELADGDAAEWALVENIQREDLNPMERAHGLAGLGARFGLSHAQLGERVGLERSTVANLIRLTELEEELQSMVSAGVLQMGHARALLGMPGGAARLALAKRAADGLWSVRQVEAAVRGSIAGDKAQNPAQIAHPTPTQREAVIADIERRLCEHLGTKVRITLGASGTKGRMQVEFYSLEQFEGLMERIGLADDGSL
ncbi:MAG: ParB/RepB/Spo0J family partition protein [Phycisphaerales bacterium]|nr:ParB/RepB/Spo0J family partition protein [Phycisphaerales bacterium]